LGVVTGIAILLVLPAAMSRASWLAVIAGSAIAGIGRWKGKIRVNPPHLCHPRSIIRYLVILVSVLLVCSACAGMYFLKKNSADGRLLTWKVSVQTIVKHPFGVGLGNFSGAYGEEQAAYFASGQASEQEELVAGNPEYGFNEYLQIGIESGIVSFLLFIGIIVLTFRSMLKNRDWAVMGSLTSLLVFAFFSYPFSVLPFGIVFVFLISIAQWNEWNADDEKGVIAGLTRNPLIDVNKCLTVLRGLRGKPAMTTLFKPAMTGIMFLLVCFCLYRQYPVYEACKTWNKIYYHSGMYKESAKEYEKLYPYLNDRIQFLFEYAQCLSKAGINDEQGIAGQARNDKVMKGAVTPDLIRGRNDRLLQSNEVLRRAMQISCDPMLYNLMGKNHQAMKEYDKAESAFIQSTRIVPSRLYPWYLLCKLHAERGMPEKANETAKIVLTKEPKVQSPAVREMREEVREIIKNYEL
jgi:tetratricopeptide (TPR) repeat protein